LAEDAPRDIREVIPETPQWRCDIGARFKRPRPLVAPLCGATRGVWSGSLVPGCTPRTRTTATPAWSLSSSPTRRAVRREAQERLDRLKRDAAAGMKVGPNRIIVSGSNQRANTLVW